MTAGLDIWPRTMATLNKCEMGTKSEATVTLFLILLRILDHGEENFYIDPNVKKVAHFVEASK